MYPKLSSDDYHWVFLETPGGLNISLHQRLTGKKKDFFIAGKTTVDAVDQHMRSLTDDLCSQWFNERERKGKNK